MSTKSTLFYNDDFHLYSEALDYENVYLDVRNNSAFVEGEFVIRIPLRVWREMRSHTLEEAERHLDMSAEEVRAEAEVRVDEHRAWLEEHKDSSWATFVGSLMYGPHDSTREAMIERYIASWRSHD